MASSYFLLLCHMSVNLQLRDLKPCFGSCTCKIQLCVAYLKLHDTPRRDSNIKTAHFSFPFYDRLNTDSVFTYGKQLLYMYRQHSTWRSFTCLSDFQRNVRITATVAISASNPTPKLEGRWYIHGGRTLQFTYNKVSIPCECEPYARCHTISSEACVCVHTLAPIDYCLSKIIKVRREAFNTGPFLPGRL